MSHPGFCRPGHGSILPQLDTWQNGEWSAHCTGPAGMGGVAWTSALLTLPPSESSSGNQRAPTPKFSLPGPCQTSSSSASIPQDQSLPDTGKPPRSNPLTCAEETRRHKVLPFAPTALPPADDLLVLHTHEVPTDPGLEHGQDLGQTLISHLLQQAQQASLEKHLWAREWSQQQTDRGLRGNTACQGALEVHPHMAQGTRSAPSTSCSPAGTGCCGGWDELRQQ